MTATVLPAYSRGMRAGVLIVAILVALVAAAPARAHMAYPGQRPATDPTARWMTAVALNHWRALGLTACPDGVQALYADSLFDTDGSHSLGRGGDCQAILLTSYVAMNRDRDRSRIPRRMGVQIECHLWMHEIGHALGLHHTTDHGVMDPTRISIPTECKHWSRVVVPVRRSTQRHA